MPKGADPSKTVIDYSQGKGPYCYLDDAPYGEGRVPAVVVDDGEWGWMVYEGNPSWHWCSCDVRDGEGRVAGQGLPFCMNHSRSSLVV